MKLFTHPFQKLKSSRIRNMCFLHNESEYRISCILREKTEKTKRETSVLSFTIQEVNGNYFAINPRFPTADIYF